MPPINQKNISDRDIFIGLMSGTSLDGVDIVAARFDKNDQPTLLAAQTFAYEEPLANKLRKLANDQSATINDMCETDITLGQLYAALVNQFIAQNQLNKSEIRAIGSHGQTIRHQPNRPQPYTLQIGDADVICAETGITTVANFRRRDLALGGQGAPLAPAFHQAVFRHSKKNRVIINIGGIANITLLAADPDQTVVGFDTGPGNTLLDYWMRKSSQQNFDRNGRFAASGGINREMIETLLSDPYFKQPPPKSTGTDYFSPDWLNQIDLSDIKPADVQASLTELSAKSIATAIVQLPDDIDECYVCGGGVHNQFLLTRLAHHLPTNCSLHSTEKLGINPDWVEGLAFAWLGRQCLLSRPGNLPSVTHSRQASILGSIHNN